MERNPEFDDIRPFYDEEVAPAIEQLLKDSQFQKIINYFYTGKSRTQIEQLMRTFTKQRDFQNLLVKKIVRNIFNRTSEGVICKGWENISRGTAYTYISNHRDIILDASILSVLLSDNGFETVEVAIGDNLLLIDWIKNMARLNKCFIVKRSVSVRQLLEVSKHLSRYIHYTILDKNQSIWIAQREGRTKDSNDRTQESLLKMLAMGSDQPFLKSLAELNLLPLAFSYEYDPCDYLKAKEFQQKRDNPDFKKTREDDLLNMKTGMLGYKGRIHLQIGRSIRSSLLDLDESLDRNQSAAQAASIIDKEIFRNYQFYPINYIAYDRLWGKDFFRDHYTSDDVKLVDEYFRRQLDKIDLPDKDIPFLTGKLEVMYANPVKNNYESGTGK